MIILNTIKSVISSVVLVLIIPEYSHAGWFGPSNFDECIIASMKGVTSDEAARIIATSCDSKYPTQNEPVVSLPESALKKVTGNITAKSHGFVNGHAYNGNSNWTITELNIWIGTQIDTKTGRRAFEREYIFKVLLNPLSNSTLIEDIGYDISKMNYSLKIVSGRGYKTK
jgi:hypothetical protein